MEIKQIKQILADQREELENSFEGEKIIKREVLEECKQLLTSSLIKIITGVRRAGKSVLGYQLLKDKNFAYVNFDDERLSFLETEDLNSVLQAIYEIYGKPDFIFFDEIQNVKNWELFVNRLQRLRFNLVITGSNSRFLSKESATHITGRHFSVELYPFSFREYLDFEGFDYSREVFTTREKALLRNFLERYILSGGFPEVVQGENYKKYLVSLYSAILTKDIISRYRVKYLRTLREFANYLISNFSRKITFNKLKNIFSLKSTHTAKNYFSFIEEAYIIFQVERFSYKFKERILAPRKVYAIDCGLINAVSSAFSPDLGHLYENAVAVELMRQKSLFSQEIYYWQKDYYEVDFVIKKGQKATQLIQVSYNMGDYDTKKREIKALLKASQELKCDDLLIITEDYEGEEKIKENTIKFVPLWKWLLESIGRLGN